MKFNVTRTDSTDNGDKKYLVVNVDEPYAGEVADLIEANERAKGTWEHGDKTMREIMGLPKRDAYYETLCSLRRSRKAWHERAVKAEAQRDELLEVAKESLRLFLCYQYAFYQRKEFIKRLEDVIAKAEPTI
ncbi:hypothetical protein H1S01_03065 [Heliobacterium chlorum]|uniref:Uncharacterized protein n=1 Tax=Heliobacterium chlorum TaxID=2698 RepID=A0ABR7T1H8_HELCL|nr:hypothetical protein [Heliobacterium chlorum]MBC9783491.1 hypothetical protein [Heliobacterium chlorum]